MQITNTLLPTSFKTLMSNPVFKLALLYLICIISHYASSHLYTTYCVEASWTGFMLSPLMTMSPHCQALRWVIYNGGYNINIMWFILGNWFLSRIRTTNFRIFGEKKKTMKHPYANKAGYKLVLEKEKEKEDISENEDPNEDYEDEDDDDYDEE